MTRPAAARITYHKDLEALRRMREGIALDKAMPDWMVGILLASCDLVIAVLHAKEDHESTSMIVDVKFRALEEKVKNDRKGS